MKYYILLLAFLVSIDCISRNISDNIEFKDVYGKYNQVDSNGLKTGPWIISSPGNYEISYYENGLKNGISRHFKEYNDSSSYFFKNFSEQIETGSYYLCSEELYRNGHITGYQISYYPNGNIWYLITSRQENTNFIESQRKYYGKGYNENLTFYQSYVYFYSYDKRLIADGWLLTYDDVDWEIDGTFVGTWNIYTKSGKQIKKTEDELNNSTKFWVIDNDDSFLFYKGATKFGIEE